MADDTRVKTDPAPDKVGRMGVETTFHYTSYSYVVLLSAPGGTLNLTAPQLVNVFGKFGRGNVIQQQKLLGVVLGDSNQLIVQLTRITFKGATEEILQELYSNSKPLVLRPFESHPAAAFGINFQLEVECPELQPTLVLKRLLSESVAGWLNLRSATMEHESSSYTLGISNEQPGRLNLSINNHIEKPEVPNFDNELLKEQISHYRRVNETMVKELYECVQKIQS